MNSMMQSRWLTKTLCSLVILASTVSVGCQVNVGGQTLPSGFYLDDDLQYFPKGPEFKLTREAAALKAARAGADINQ
jgi:hypothetical protein